MRLSSYSYKFLRLLTTLLGCSFLTGCLVSKEPFYLNDQIELDHKIEGFYPNKQDESTLLIRPSMDYDEHYDIVVQDGKQVTISLVGTLFAFNNVHYLDLFYNSDTGIRHDAASPPTVSAVIRYLMFEPYHLLLRVELADDSLTFWCPSRKSITEAIKSDSNIKMKRGGDTILFDEPTDVVQRKLIALFSNGNFFDHASNMVKQNDN